MEKEKKKKKRVEDIHLRFSWKESYTKLFKLKGLQRTNHKMRERERERENRYG